MSDADSRFLSGLFEGQDLDDVAQQLVKQGQLTQDSIAALDVKQPELLDQLEEQAAESPPPEEPEEEQPQEAPAEEEPPTPEEVVPLEEADTDPELIVPKDFFKRPETHPMSLLVVLKNKYNDEWVRWLPETLWEAIRKDFGPISEVNQNKIQAISVALSTDAPWQDWTTFENCGKSFNNTIPVFGQIQPLSPIEAAFTVSLLKKLNVFDFSDEVAGYIAAICLYNGIIFAPNKWFDGAQRFIDAQNKNPELRDEVKAAWKALEKQELYDVELKEDNPLHVHVVKLWAVKEYLRDMQSQLKASA